MCGYDTGSWLRGEHGGAGVTVGLDDLRVLFQSKCFYDSMKGMTHCADRKE